jgi:serine/threonine-protein kinase RsbT
MDLSSEAVSRVAIHNAGDVVLARQLARRLAAQLGFGKADQTRLATAVSELTRNVIEYAGNGECLVFDASDDVFRCIRIVVEDHGPGIADLGRAMQDGYSTGGSLGAGLPGTKRLVNSFLIESSPGLTRITISMAIRKVLQ